MSTHRPFMIVLVLLVAAFAVAAALASRFAVQTYERALLAQFPVEPVVLGHRSSPVVFVGDSRVVAWASHDRFDALFVGFPGATLSQIETGVGRHLSPSADLDAIVIQAGVNDLRWLGMRPDALEARVAASFLDLQRLVAVCQGLADRVLLMTLLPVGEPGLLRRPVWSDAVGGGVELMNRRILAHTWPGSVQVLDAGTALGVLDADLFTDELHFSTKAYLRLTDWIAGFLKPGQ